MRVDPPLLAVEADLSKNWHLPVANFVAYAIIKRLKWCCAGTSDIVINLGGHTRGI
jgi:hypothetical protein